MRIHCLFRSRCPGDNYGPIVLFAMNRGLVGTSDESSPHVQLYIYFYFSAALTLFGRGLRIIYERWANHERLSGVSKGYRRQTGASG
jgi:hypothetical protein